MGISHVKIHDSIEYLDKRSLFSHRGCSIISNHNEPQPENRLEMAQAEIAVVFRNTWFIQGFIIGLGPKPNLDCYNFSKEYSNNNK